MFELPLLTADFDNFHERCAEGSPLRIANSLERRRRDPQSSPQRMQDSIHDPRKLCELYDKGREGERRD